MAGKIKTPVNPTKSATPAKGKVGLLNRGPLSTGYAVGTSLKEIYNIPADSSEQSKLMAMQSTKDAMNRTRWANFEGKLTNYPKGHTVPSFQYTPAMTAELKKRGMDRNYIESWQPHNYTEEKEPGYQEGGEIISSKTKGSLSTNGILSKAKGRRTAATEARNESLKRFNPEISMHGKNIPLPDYDEPGFMKQANWRHATKTNMFAKEPYTENGWALFNPDANPGRDPEQLKAYRAAYDQGETDYDRYRVTKAYTEATGGSEYRDETPKNKAIRKNKVDAISYQEGGEVVGPPPFDYDSLTAGADTKGMAGNALSSGIGLIGDVGSQALQESKANDLKNYDVRDNPNDVLNKANKKDTGAALLKGAGKGAAAGAMFGPVGAAIGAAAGTLISGIGRLIGKKGRDEEVSKATSEWSGSRTGLQASYERSTGYKEGGKVEGKGTAKSDSIKMTAEDGSFIVPAENAEAGMDLGKTYLGWNKDTVAERQNGGDGIKVSDGEVFFTPEETNTLKYYGINIDSLAPKAESQNKATMTPGTSKAIKYKAGQYVDGGWVYDTTTGRVVDEANGIAYDSKGNEYTKDTSGNMTLSSEGTMVGKSIYAKHGAGNEIAEAEKPVDQADPAKEEEEFKRKWYDYVPELAGTIQALGGAHGLIAAGKAPDLTVSHTLKKLSAETRRLAQFGYEPQVLNALDTQIEKARRDVNKSITGRGGSPMEVMAQLQSTLGTVIDKKAGVMMGNAREKSRKWADVIKIDSQIGRQEFDIQKINLEDWYKTQDVYANMLSAGISNTIGARQLKNEQDLMREIDTNVTFSRT